MPLLFTMGGNNLEDFFGTISREDIKDSCESKVYFKGLEYYDNNFVTESAYNASKTRLQAIVKGRANYKVTIQLQNSEVLGSCTCPYESVCKHMIATLLFAVYEKPETERITSPNNSENENTQYLYSLSKEELVRLIMKFAPQQFWVEVKNKFADNIFAENAFKKVERNIKNIFKDQERLYEPDDFDTALNKEVKKLSGLEKHLKEKIAGLLFYIMTEVAKATDEGYLYNDYNDYAYETSNEFDEFVINYVKCLDYEEKMAFLEKLDAALEEQPYSTFESLSKLSETVFTKEDLPLLKNMLVSDYQKMSIQLVENYYEKVCNLLSAKEKEVILTRIKDDDSKWLIELAILYESQQEIKKAINTIKIGLAENNDLFGNERVYSLYLDLLKKAGLNLMDAAIDAIFHCPTCTMLLKVTSVIEDGYSACEQILEKENAGQLLEYLETNARHSEGLALIKRSKYIGDTQVFSFFKKNKKQFPSDAENYYSSVINKNLKFAGDHYYQAIADSIEQLKQVNASLAKKYLSDIRLNYKRRRNLISLLSKC